MREYSSVSRSVFQLFNYLFLSLAALLCMLPFLHILAQSFSTSISVAANEVMFWPVDFTTAAYEKVFGEGSLLRSMGVTLQRVALGVSVNMLFTLLMAYPLSKENHFFRGRTVYAWTLVFTLLFGGGLIPFYLIVSGLGMMDTIWALVLPTAVPVYNVVLMLNFFRSIPKELDESAYIDGASQLIILFRIYVPLSMPSMATLTLFATVGHWNSWFDGLIFMNDPANYPLSSYLQTMIIPLDVKNLNNLDDLSLISERTVKNAQIMIGALPILLVYPFVQRYFVKGIILGAVKE
ncbi:carbohydrate ABC transporter permease [Paenibacillus sp. J5C_2022]|uniref:carbohydrate ABC transporter permease n=1 Tax=Paenibacillus sp. J5C2022 TaxID=2977129 RepID=UPI0021D04FDD|nr:carbohydrate ABC transporter permease [Paenibacillus sp. J5C2022]MCU6712280.1 carbohydrate ABC transporter permease [Paenibacillus sp. J5C2022]